MVRSVQRRHGLFRPAPARRPETHVQPACPWTSERRRRTRRRTAMSNLAPPPQLTREERLALAGVAHLLPSTPPAL
ncbi:hypothetical protein SPRG_08927 [Saprolegnia parasitica CBS 223.65]|uniref:Uncharacterized protein n=1 Tax=Saprolegnia parasitica (strain CBS 223.65) TaxID=695850 RepID=A0A067C537_SAPPC|nr:hypothetical protein SPRG_08927 [Saprolegnia parasitica CBS 223.65]KDO25628.1 hypothetical protein SPRG_08927 [Saprolegnia parasitica CBS 223.65]|eukprot:XP_012203661.1 hypothetical protein SPRG_08927 [Saprolegnia parasitica CBS 223.65]